MRSSEKLDAVRRLEIYATAYFIRIHNSLKEDFPTVHAVVGDESFLKLIREYLSDYPPHHYSLRYAGKFFSRFLRDHSLQKKYVFLADLAHFEWELLEAFDAPDADVLLISDLESCAPEAWPDLHLQLVPSAQFVQLEFPVWEIRKHYLSTPEHAFPFEGLRAKTSSVLLWRYEYEVMYREVEEKELALLHLLQKGKVFSAFCEEAEDLIGKSEEDLLQLTQTLATWVRSGLLAK